MSATTPDSIICSVVTAQRQWQGANPPNGGPLMAKQMVSSPVLPWSSLTPPARWSGGKAGRYQGAGSSSQGGLSSSLSTASTSPSGAWKNNQEMTSWLHHFLDFKARKSPGDICPCLYVAGYVEPQHCSEAMVLERPSYVQRQGSPRPRKSDPNGCPQRAQPQRKTHPLPKGQLAAGLQHFPCKSSSDLPFPLWCGSPLGGNCHGDSECLRH